MRSLCLLFVISMAGVLSGCFDPQYGPEAFSCKRTGNCPSGYTCHPVKAVCVKEGTGLDQGTGKDVESGDLLSDQDSLLGTDITLLPDSKVWPDAPKGAPSVKLDKPADKATTPEYYITFSFELKAGTAPVSRCELFLNGKLAATRNTPPAGLVKIFYNAEMLNPGSYVWYVKCIDTNKKEAATPSRAFYVKTEVLSKCKVKGFKAITSAGSCRSGRSPPPRAAPGGPWGSGKWPGPCPGEW